LPYNQGKRRFSPARRETSVKLHRSSFFLAAFVAAGALTFFLSVVLRDRTDGALPYSRPAGGEREGDFELFIGS